MTSIENSQKVIDRIKLLNGFQSDKEVAALLDLTPADFSNRKKRDTLIPLIIEWALRGDLDLNELLKGSGAERKGNKYSDQVTQYKRPVYAMVGNLETHQWLSDSPSEEIILSDEFGSGVLLVKMTGTSMDPTISEGAIFAVECGVTGFTSGQVFVVWIPHEGPIVRRVFVDLEKVTLKADNGAFLDIVIPISNIPKEDFILGRVKWGLQLV